MEHEILDHHPSKDSNESRSELLPTWIKVFCWIFLVFGAFFPVTIGFGFFGINLDLSIYGLDAFRTFSPTGLLIIALFAFKSAVAFGLFTKKDWAVDLAIIDGVLGIVICAFMMLVVPFIFVGGLSLVLRLELIALIPYFIKMRSIKSGWTEAANAD